MKTVLIFGSTGFVGSAVTHALTRQGHRVRRAEAPRLSTSARTLEEIRSEAVGVGEELGGELAGTLDDVDAVINTAGMAVATTAGHDSVFGANALLPAAIAVALADAARSAWCR